MAGLSTPSSTPRATLRRLEELGFNAWPALHTVLHEGWVLRFADGYTKRANSANALHPGDQPVARLIADVEAAYRLRGLRPVFRITPLAPPAVDAALAGLGYALFDESLVQHVAAAAAAAPDPSVVIEPLPTPAWLGGYAGAAGLDAVASQTLAAMLARIPPPVGFARLVLDGDAVAFAFAVRERGHVGLFDVVTRRDARRRGLGRRLVTALLDWGRRHDAETAYLQVVAANAPARRLYARLGFATAYAYHYRIAPG